MRLLTLMAVAIAPLVATNLQAADATPQEIKWNVFLADWHLLGPFPKEDETGLDTKYVPNEATLSTGQVHFYENKLYTWKPYDGRVIDFRKGLGVTGSRGENKVGYAWTQFVSPVAQTVQMGVAYDDYFVGWLNGKEVARGTDGWASSLDQEVVDVDLKAGVNTLLIRVANGRTKWDAAVRFLPAELKKPLFTFKATPTNNNVRLPVIDVDLLDARRKVISKHQCSGARQSYPGVAGYYALYTQMPDPAPAFVRLTVRQPYFREFERVAPWSRAQTGNALVKLFSAQPTSLLVVDKVSRQPIEAAQIWSTQERAEPTTDSDGKVTLTEVSPMSDRLYVVANGYEAATVNLKWPRGGMQRVELVKGGKTLTGTVVSTTGEPLPGATVTSGLSGYSPTAIADEQGAFAIYGLPKDRTTLYPVIEAKGFVTKGRFSFQLTGDDTKVKWELAPGATIIGRVIHEETGEPIPGIKVTVGDSRFGGSNDKAPTATTNDNGRYRLTGVSDGQNLVHAFSDDYAPAMKTVSVVKGTETTADFTLKVGKPVTGTITDVTGKPIAGVWLVTDTWNGVRMFRREDRTNSKGEFTLAHMPESVTEVDILKSGFISNRDFEVRGGDTFDLTMKPVITHTITIRDAAKGKIVPNLQIAKGYLWEGSTRWSWQTSEYQTTRYYDKLKGAMKIEIDEPINSQIAYRFRATGFKEEIVNIPAEAIVGKEFKVELQPSQLFEGRVVFAPTGEPLGQVAVAFVSKEDRMRTDHYVTFTSPWEYLEQKRFTGQHTVTDENGLFRLSMPGSKSDHQLVLISRPNAFHVISDLDAMLASHQPGTEVLEFPLPQPATLEGRVTVAGKPLVNEPIRLSWTGYDEGSNNQAFGFGGQIKTDANGAFKYEAIGPGRYQLSRVFSFSTGQGGTISTYLDTQNLIVRPGETVTHNLIRPAGMTLTGVTRDSEGKPVSDTIVKVTARDDLGRQIDATTSDKDGRFTLTHLPSASYTLSAEHYSYGNQRFYSQDLRGSTSIDLSESTDNVTINMVEIASQSTVQRTVTPIAKTIPPDFTVTPTATDKPFTLSEKFGKVTVVCFWGESWLTNAKTISDTYEKFRNNPDVEFLTVFLRDQKQLQFIADRDFPVVATKPGTPGQLSSIFGTYGRSACFVIGRDGRFATEKTTIAQLSATIEQALTQQWDESLTVEATSRLAISLSTDGGSRGVAGAQVRMKAFEADGKLVREDSYSGAGVPGQINWRYPRLSDGGQLQVTVSGKGIKTQTEIVSSPEADQTLAIDFESPRLLTGTVVTEKKGAPVADMRVQIQGYGGEILTATTDVEGRFSVRCFPGNHQVVAVGNERFAGQTSSSRTVWVAEEVDPQSLILRVVPAVTVKGRVVDKDGAPVAGATILYNGLTTVISNAEGAFELSGVASTGRTLVWAMATGNGAIWLSSPDVEKIYTITLGEVPRNGGSTSGDEVTAGKVAEFEVTTLNGDKTSWQPEAETDRLLVFCALWHPSSKTFLEKARTWSEENDTPIEVVSLDWNLEQARRESASQKLTDRTVFAGPGKLNLDSQWPLVKGRGAFLIGSDGKLKGTPLE